jgi:hypothetical protein
MPIYACFALSAAGLVAALVLALRGSTVMAALTFFLGHDHRLYRHRRHVCDTRLQGCQRPSGVHHRIGDRRRASNRTRETGMKSVTPDLVLVNPTSRARIYQSLGKRLTAVENPVWAGLIATFVRTKGFSVEIVDAEADELTPQDVAERLAALSPVLAAIVVYGHQPSASTQNMTGASALASAIKASTPALPLLMLGGHVAALPERTLEDEPCDFVSSDEGLQTVVDLLSALKASRTPDLSSVRDSSIEWTPVPFATRRRRSSKISTARWPASRGTCCR